jgi:hypothetical protein
MPTGPRVRARERIFVSCSFADADAQAFVDQLRKRFEVVQTEGQPSALPRALAVKDALQAVDLAVVLLPAEQDPAYRSVVYEAGAAVGSGARVVVVGEAATVPPMLEGLHRILPGDLQAFDDAVATAVRKRGTRRVGSGSGVPGEAPALDTAAAAAARANLLHARSEVELVHWMMEVFRAAGASVVAARIGGSTAYADLTVWHDGLEAAFGLPLPVELVSAGHLLLPLVPRLRRTMRAAGTRSLLAVSGPGRTVHARWSGEDQQILAVDAARLVDELANASLPRALAALLATAAPL